MDVSYTWTFLSSQICHTKLQAILRCIFHDHHTWHIFLNEKVTINNTTYKFLIQLKNAIEKHIGFLLQKAPSQKNKKEHRGDIMQPQQRIMYTKISPPRIEQHKTTPFTRLFLSLVSSSPLTQPQNPRAR